MNSFSVDQTIKKFAKKEAQKSANCERYSKMYNDIQDVLDLTTFNSSLIMMLASKNGDFLVNHRFTLDSRNPRYSFYTQYKKENFQLNSVFVIQPGVKASMIWSPTKWFTQEMSAIVLKQENNAFWNTLVSRSVYADPHTCCELVVPLSLSLHCSWITRADSVCMSTRRCIAISLLAWRLTMIS